MKAHNGFTLIELILTIVVVGIIALAASNTLLLGFQSYNDSIDRQDNQMQAKFVTEKVSRELRHAVPNSITVDSLSGQCIQFIPIEASAFYLALPSMGESTIDTAILDDSPPNMNGVRLVINPSNQADLLDSDNHRFVTINSVSVSSGISTIQFSTPHNPAFISDSISDRAYLYRPNVIEYCIQNGGVFRSGIQIANRINGGRFSFEPASLNRNSTINMTLQFVNDVGELTQYQHDVQVLNVP